MTSEIKQTWTSDSRQIEAVYEKLKKLDLELIERQRKLHKQTKEGADAFSKWGDEQAKFVKGLPAMAFGLVSVEGAVSAIADGFASWKANIAAATAGAREFTRELAKSVALSSDAMSADVIKGKIHEFQLSGGSGAQLLGFREGFRGGAPTASTAQTLEATGLTKHLVVGDAGAFGRRAGRLFEREGMNAEQAVAVAARLGEINKTGADQVTSDEGLRSVDALVASKAFASREEALAWLATVGERMSPKAALQMAEAIATKQVGIRPHAGQPLSEADRANNQFVGLDASAKRRLFETSASTRRAFLGMKGAGIDNMDWSTVAKNTKMLQDAEEEGGVDRIVAEQRTQKVFRDAAREQAATGYSEAAKATLAKQINRGDVDQFIDSVMNERGWGGAHQWLAKATVFPSWMTPEQQIHEALGRGLSAHEFAEYYTTVRPEQTKGPVYLEEERLSRERDPSGWRGVPEHPQLKELTRILDRVERNTRDTPAPVVPGGHTDSR